MANPSIVFNILSKDDQALASLKRLQRETKELGNQVDKTKGSGLGLGDALGGLAIGAGFAFAISEAEEAAASMRSTQAVIESTGNAAEVSAEQQMELVDALSQLGGVDDEVVNAGANILRTFTSIKGENFGLALGAALDIAAMKGQDLATVAEQIGKALNDPVAGMGKLAKQGVVLSDTQKQLVRDLAAVGDTAGAQRVILQELETEYGGQAEANATASGRFQVAVGNLAESIGTALLPVMSGAATVAGRFTETFSALPQPVQLGALALGAAAVAANRFSDQLEKINGTLRAPVGELGKFNTAAASATTGLVAFTTAYGYLQDSIRFKGDMSQAVTDFQQFAEGTATVDEALTEFGGSVEDFADTVKLANTSGLGVLTVDTRDLGKAKKELHALDDTLAQMVESGQAEEAEALFVELSKALADQGVATEDLVRWMDDYIEAEGRATRGSRDLNTASAELAEDGIKKAEDALRNKADALRTVNDETERGIGLITGRLGAAVGYESAVASVSEAQLALAAAEKEGDAHKIAEARRNLTLAIDRQAQAAVDLAVATAEAEGRTVDAGQQAVIYAGELDKARESTGFWNDELQKSRDQLTWLSKTHRITVEADVSQAKREMEALIGLQLYSAWLESGGPASGNRLPGTPEGLPYGTPGTMGPPSAPRSLRSTSDSGVSINVQNMNVMPGKRDLEMAAMRASTLSARSVLRMAS